ncbi:MAG TPA: MauE/DoxX family redox-associated membrane protein [Acidimicrobiales bacterium]|nr:MauE/DoxX family redox-associated membrane protein [Acidimicrobiales bacterium]
MVLFAPYLAACALLAVAGVAKAARPADTARALAQSLPAWAVRPSRLAVRAGAGLEAALGVAALVWPARPLAAAVAASYLAFCAFVLVARARGGALASCGCFGTPDTPPTLSHVAVDAVAAAAAATVAAAGRTGLLGPVLAHQHDHGWPLAVLAAVLAWLAYLVLVPLTRLGALRAARPPTAGVWP